MEGLLSTGPTPSSFMVDTVMVVEGMLMANTTIVILVKTFCIIVTVQ